MLTMRNGRWGSFGLLVAGIGLVALVVLAVPAAEALATVPADFENRLIANVAGPTALAFTPDGRLLIGSRPGRLYVYRDGALVATPALDLAGRTCSNSERGLLGVAVSPDFAANHAIYVYYTFNKSGTCTLGSSGSAGNRVSRFELSADNHINPASETVLMDNIASLGVHNAGDLHFGPDGYLYVSVGDGQTGDDARKPNVINGKILRLTEAGDVPPANPFVGPGSARCNRDGRTTAGSCDEVFAMGLRNPFRFAMDPNSASTRFFINDVGENLWEEIDQGQAGADYGWKVREGPCRFASSTDCGSPPTGMTNPIWWYNHDTGCTAITAAAFVPDGVWPGYDGAYLYGDFICGKIFALTRDGAGPYRSAVFASGVGAIVTMAFGPYNGTQALFYTVNPNGEVHRIDYTGPLNRQPNAIAEADQTYGDLPLTVRFDGTRSNDPDGDLLVYDWDFGDGSHHASTDIASHTYETAETYHATLTVTDPGGLSDQASIEIQAGNHPPTVTIDNPSSDYRFRVGETISLLGHASDLEDKTLPDGSLKWTAAIRHNNTHSHPYLTDVPGNNVELTTPGPEDLPTAYNSYLELALTATDSKGLSTTVAQELLPHLVPLTFETNPSGLKIQANGIDYGGPTTLTSWEGYPVSLAAPGQTDGNGNSWQFVSWSDGGAATHTVATPAAARSYTANFQRVANLNLFADDFETGNLSRWTRVNGLLVQQATVFSGRFAARATSTGSPAYAYKQLATAETGVTGRVRFKLLRRGSGSIVTLLRFQSSAGGRIVSVNVSGSGTVSCRNHTTGVTHISSTRVSLGVWHDLQARVLVQGAASKVTVTYDGITIASLNRTESLGSTKVGRFELGDDSTGRSYDVAFDELTLARS